MTTPLDKAHAAMMAAGEDDDSRLAFFGQVAGSELHLLLSAEAQGDSMIPEVFETGDGTFVLAFDTEDRLTAFTGEITPHATLSGRKLAALLAGQGVGIGLNLEVASSSMLVPAAAVNWLHRTLGARPKTTEARPRDVSAPGGLPEKLISALDARLAAATGLAQTAYLVAVTYDDGTRGHLLAVVGAAPAAETALSDAIGEALIFSGLEAGALDVAFVRPTDDIAPRLAKVGLRFDLPEPEVLTPSAPGRDPNKPPTLR